MILGVGTDILSTQRIERILAQYPERFLQRILTKPERALIGPNKLTWVAKRYAAKEAISKACGTGISSVLSFHDIEITNNERGQPVATLSDKAQKALQALHSLAHPVKVHLSLSDEPPYVLAYAVIEIKK